VPVLLPLPNPSRSGARFASTFINQATSEFIVIHKTLKPAAAAAVVLALSFGPAWGQATGASGAPGGPTGAGSSVTGGGAAPSAQPGTGTRNTPTSQDDKLARGDRKFIEDAAASGMFEVQVSKLAAAQATDPAVRNYAQMLVEHHSAANNALVQIANARRVELPPGPPRAMRNDMEKLAKKTGEDFDREYVREVGIKAHEKDIKMFEKASKDVKDPQLKAWVDQTLPTL
jgi:putative membrane protein